MNNGDFNDMNFSVTLVSDSSLKYFPDNNSTLFTNVLYKKIQLPEKLYQVALSEIFYEEAMIDRTQTQNTYFGTPTANNFVKVWDGQGVVTQHEKKTNNLQEWIANLERVFGILSLATVNVTIKLSVQKDETGKLKAKLHFQDLNNIYSLRIKPPKYAEMLGFKKSVFAPGNHLSENAVNEQEFAKFPIGDKITLQCTDESPKLLEISEPLERTQDALIANIIVSFITHGILVRMPISTNRKLKVYIDQRNLRFQLPVIANRALRLPDEFIFEDKEITVDLNKIIPSTPKEYKESLQVLVMTSLIQEQFYGSKCLPILRIFKRPTDKKKHQILFDPLYFHDLKYDTFHDIQITLVGESESQIAPADSPTTIVLQFRRKTL